MIGCISFTVSSVTKPLLLCSLLTKGHCQACTCGQEQYYHSHETTGVVSGLEARRGYNLTHRSRPVRTDDFYEFDLIIGMDDRNIDDLKERAHSVEACGKIHRMTEYCTKFAHADYVPDPYYGGAEGFEYVLDILEDACAGLLGAVGE